MRADVTPSKPRDDRGFVVEESAATRGVRWFVAFKWLVYALLALNVVLYGRHGTVTEQIDTAAWVVLLLLFEWETGGWTMSPRQRRLAHALRALASVAVVGACVDYALQLEWLDFCNAVTWLLVVVALELEVRVPAHWRGFHRARQAATGLLYLALAAFLLAWLAMSASGGAPAWLDAWDAALWLVAFVVIELNVFGFAQTARARHASG
ncbi:MAG TPA: hypothetical protein VEY50_01720 [Lysobacter sp.]|nr:hypothetical protein [Lysobacter sp.]